MAGSRPAPINTGRKTPGPSNTTTTTTRPPLSPVASRLPTLKTRPHHTASTSNLTNPEDAGTSGRPGASPDAWMSTNAANSVVAPAVKSGRPGLRNVKKRRSSFSAADVVA
jgi:cell division cycle 14